MKIQCAESRNGSILFTSEHSNSTYIVAENENSFTILLIKNNINRLAFFYSDYAKS